MRTRIYLSIMILMVIGLIMIGISLKSTNNADQHSDVNNESSIDLGNKHTWLFFRF